jgi:hypothetical protein
VLYLVFFSLHNYLNKSPKSSSLATSPSSPSSPSPSALFSFSFGAGAGAEGAVSPSSSSSVLIPVSDEGPTGSSEEEEVGGEDGKPPSTSVPFIVDGNASALAPLVASPVTFML